MCVWLYSLLLVFLASVATLVSVAALHAAGAATAVWGVEAEVNVLLRVDAHHEGGHVHDLLADADVALANENARVVDGLGEAELHHLCRQGGRDQAG